jgi:hypothetical protein
MITYTDKEFAVFYKVLFIMALADGKFDPRELYLIRSFETHMNLSEEVLNMSAKMSSEEAHEAISLMSREKRLFLVRMTKKFALIDDHYHPEEAFYIKYLLDITQLQEEDL